MSGRVAVRELRPRTFEQAASWLADASAAGRAARPRGGGTKFAWGVPTGEPKTVISTGIVVPMSFAVCALNALTNSMMLMPCWPSAGPTGGAGEAWPPGAWSLMVVRTFLAMS